MLHPLESLRDVILPLLEKRKYHIFPDTAFAGTTAVENFIEAYSHDSEIHNHYEWMWLVSGEAHMKIKGAVYRLTPGDFCFLPPQVPHADVYDRSTPAYESLWFIHSPGLLSFATFTYQPFGKQRIEHHGGVYAAGEIGVVFALLQKEMAQREEYSGPLVHGLMLQLAALLLRAMKGAKTHSGAVSSRVLDFLQRHYQRDLTLEEIARHTFLTPNYLAAVFKRETGQTIFQALSQIRIEHAARLILENQTPLSQIAEAVGYNSYDRFARVFREVKGVSPKYFGQSLASKKT